LDCCAQHGRLGRRVRCARLRTPGQGRPILPGENVVKPRQRFRWQPAPQNVGYLGLCRWPAEIRHETTIRRRNPVAAVAGCLSRFLSGSTKDRENTAFSAFAFLLFQ
jgi:hypothetical protein